MSDILERLRREYEAYGRPVVGEAIKEIERLGGNAKCDACRQGLALCADYNGTSTTPRKYHMTANGFAVPHVE